MDQLFAPIIGITLALVSVFLPALVTASGAVASARKSIGITVFSGMIASTCLAVLFVPTFFVVIQRFESWLKLRRPNKPQSEMARAPQTRPSA